MLPMDAPRIIIEVSHLHDKWRNRDYKQIPFTNSVSQQKKAEEMDDVIYRPAVKVVKKKDELMPYRFLIHKDTLNNGVVEAFCDCR